MNIIFTFSFSIQFFSSIRPSYLSSLCSIIFVCEGQNNTSANKYILRNRSYLYGRYDTILHAIMIDVTFVIAATLSCG